MNDLEERTRESLRELVDAYQPGAVTLSPVSAVTPGRRSGRTVTIAAVLIGAALAAGVVIRFGGAESVTHRETGIGPTTIAPVSSPVPEVTVSRNSGTPNGPVVPPVSVSNPSQPTAPSQSQPPSQALQGPGGASCAFEYNTTTLSQRGFAFDGTVLSVGEPPPATGFADPYIPVQFVVNEWFKGAGPDTFTVHMFPPNASTSLDQTESGPRWGIGSRLLITGESQYGAGVLIDPVVWTCGFSRTYDAPTANQWRQAFSTTAVQSASTVQSSGIPTGPASPEPELPSTSTGDRSLSSRGSPEPWLSRLCCS